MKLKSCMKNGSRLQQRYRNLHEEIIGKGWIEMSEIEVKVLDIDIDRLKEQLLDLGAKLVKKEHQINNMFDYEDERLLKSKGFVRVREIKDELNGEEKCILGFKKMISQIKYKEMLEEETEVADANSIQEILINIGLKKVRSDKKYRESYQISDVLYEIDIWDKDVYPYPYLEVEAPNQQSLEKGLENIGLTLNDVTAKSLHELAKEEKNKQKKSE